MSIIVIAVIIDISLYREARNYKLVNFIADFIACTYARLHSRSWLMKFFITLGGTTAGEVS